MAISTLYCFVDTNLFIQCRPLKEIDWSLWQAHEEVRLIVSSPVLREIDHLKTKGNDRLGKRARAASATFREMLNETCRQVHATSPRVVLSIEPQHMYDSNLEGQLNYQERDDQLLGTVHKFARSNPLEEVRLLTHDTMPLFKARSLNLAADQIPDDWLLPPETTKAEKELAALKAENSRLKLTEPSISLRCLDQSGKVIDKYCTSYTWYKPLTSTEVADLMEILKARFPLETEFGSREPADQSAPMTAAKQFLANDWIFTPATNEEIENYREKAYPQWLKHCEKMLREHHQVLQQKIQVLEFEFIAKNCGTRPAIDALITIEARGDFQVKPPSSGGPDKNEEDEDDTSVSANAKVLPQPPVAPRGTWNNRIVGQLGDVIGTLDRFARWPYAFPRPEQVNFNPIISHIDLPQIELPPPHDPNEFYYKPVLPSVPQNSFALECTQWRHGDEEESFVGEIHVPTDLHEVKGLLVCHIQAGNLSNAILSRIPVRIAIVHVSAFESARSMVNLLVDKPSDTIE